MDKIIELILGLLRPAKPAQTAPVRIETPSPIYLITRREILMGRDAEFPLDHVLEHNLSELLKALNRFRWAYGKSMVVRSGYRPGKYNVQAKGSKNSAHLTCEAVDFVDADRTLARYVLANPRCLVDADLYMEMPEHTPSWVHLTTRAPASGKRIFRP